MSPSSSTVNGSSDAHQKMGKHFYTSSTGWPRGDYLKIREVPWSYFGSETDVQQTRPKSINVHSGNGEIEQSIDAER